MPLACYPIDLSVYANPIFVETGSFNGSGIEAALAQSFEEIHSIEFDLERYRALCKRFHGNDRVHLYHGESQHKLREIIPKLDKPATFWLDAHDDKQSPLKEELIAIKELSAFKNIILVDDLNWFYCWKFTEEDIRALILDIDPNYQFARITGSKPESVLTAVPKPAK